MSSTLKYRAASREKRLIAASIAAVFLVLLPSFSGAAFGSSASQASFTGTASIHLVGKDASGNVVTMQVTSSFTVVAKPGGPGVGSMDLNLPGIMDIPGVVSTGRIVITGDRVSGGGTEAVAPMGSQFALSVGSGGGVVQCLMAGFSAGFDFNGLTVLQMDVHGTVPAGALVLS